MVPQARRSERKTDPEPEAVRSSRRVVLRQAHVLVVGDDVDDQALATALKDVKLPLSIGKTLTVAWVVVGEFDGLSKERAIEAHAGKPGTADARPGTYKAPTVKAWAGGVRYVRPPMPLIEKEAIQ